MLVVRERGQYVTVRRVAAHPPPVIAAECNLTHGSSNTLADGFTLKAPHQAVHLRQQAVRDVRVIVASDVGQPKLYARRVEDVPDIFKSASAEHALSFTDDNRVKLVFAALDAAQQFRCVRPSYPGYGAGDFVKNFFYDSATLAARNDLTSLLALPSLRVQATL